MLLYRFFLFALIAWFAPRVAANDQNLVLSHSGNQKLQRCSERILTTAYQNIGYRVTLKEMPSLRGLITANKGGIDGLFARIAGTEMLYPHLIPVKVPICSVHLQAYSNEDLQIRKIEELNGLKVGIKKGSLAVLKLLNDIPHTTYVTTDILLNLLANKRIDVAILAENRANILIQREHYNLFELDIEIEPVFLYHYLHQKNKSLVNKVTKSLTELEKSGFITQANLEQKRKSEKTTTSALP